MFHDLLTPTVTIAVSYLFWFIFFLPDVWKAAPTKRNKYERCKERIKAMETENGYTHCTWEYDEA